MKVAVVGGGGFRAPLVWESLSDQPVDRVVLHDVDAHRLARVGAVIDGLRAERGGGPPVTTTTDLEDAVDGADFVFCAIRVGGLEGRVVDETVPLRQGVLGQETVGPGGICFALRTLPQMLAIADVVAKRAPAAWFLNFTNPAGLVTEALRGTLGDRVVGICDSPTGLCARVARALGRRAGDLRFDYAGLNHLGWLLAVYDGDRDLLPDLLDDTDALGSVMEVQLFGTDRVRDLGMIPNEYLVYYEKPDEIVRAFDAAGATRAEVLRGQIERFYVEKGDALASWRRARDARFGTYMAEAWDENRMNKDDHSTNGDDPGEAGYAAIATAFIGATTTRRTTDVILDVPNRGRLSFLDDDAVIEAPCRVSADNVEHDGGRDLPREQRELVARVKEVERVTIRASLESSRALALDALAAHPVVGSRETAATILAGYLEAFPSLAERLT
jgi:6-phospho-beta-glucosidase